VTIRLKLQFIGWSEYMFVGNKIHCARARLLADMAWGARPASTAVVSCKSLPRGKRKCPSEASDEQGGMVRVAASMGRLSVGQPTAG